MLAAQVSSCGAVHVFQSNYPCLWRTLNRSSTWDKGLRLSLSHEASKARHNNSVTLEKARMQQGWQQNQSNPAQTTSQEQMPPRKKNKKCHATKNPNGSLWTRDHSGSMLRPECPALIEELAGLGLVCRTCTLQEGLQIIGMCFFTCCSRSLGHRMRTNWEAGTTQTPGDREEFLMFFDSLNSEGLMMSRDAR